MKKFISILLICSLGVIGSMTFSSCRGKAATKTFEIIKKASSKGGKAAKNVGKYADDVVRTVNNGNSNNNTSASTLQAVTYQCPSCAGYGQVDFVDEYGEYAYTGTCPDCGGEGTVTQYEYE